jgi:hypothetical protein
VRETGLNVRVPRQKKVGMQITYNELKALIESASAPAYASRYYPGISGHRALNEGLSWEDMLKDLAAAAASSGALAVTGGAGGDIVVDTIFAIDTGKEVLESVQSAISALKEVGAVIGRAVKLSISSGPQAFMAEVKSILIDVMGMIGEEAKKVVNKLAKSVQSIINKVVRAISKWVAALFPADFGLAGPGFETAVTSALSSATETAFDSTMGAIESLGDTGRMLVDQGAMEKFLSDLTSNLLDFADDVQYKIDNPDPEKSGFFKGLIAQEKHKWEMISSFTGMASLADKLGFQTDSAGEDYLQMIEALPSWHPGKKLVGLALPKATEFLETVKAEYIPLAGQIMTKLMSYLFACIALLQLVSDPVQREELLAAADKKRIERDKAISKMTPEERVAASKKAGEDLFGSDVDLDLGLSERKTRRRTKRMRISERKIKQQLKRELTKRRIRRLVEQVASGNDVPPTEESVNKAAAAVEQGAQAASGDINPEGVLGKMTAYAKKMGFGDPCEYVKANKKQVENELMTMEQAKAALEGDDPTEGLQKAQSLLTKLGMGSLVGVAFSWKNMQMAKAAQIPARAAAMATDIAGASAQSAASSGWLSWLPGSTAAAEAGGAMVADAAATTAALDAAVASSATFMGVSYAAWVSIGQILAILAAAIWVYRWLVKSGVACNIKEFVVGLGSAVANAASWAYSNVVKPFIAKFKTWGGKVVDVVKSKLSDWFASDEKTAMAESYRRGLKLSNAQLASLHEAKTMHIQERLEAKLACRRLQYAVNNLCYNTF